MIEDDRGENEYRWHEMTDDHDEATTQPLRRPLDLSHDHELTGQDDRNDGQDGDIKVGVVRFGEHAPSVPDARLTAQMRPRRRRSAA
jgi:hypothetical protein